MIIHGRECGFRFTVRASIEVAELCPEKDLGRLGELFEGTYQDIVAMFSKLAVILNKAYEEAVAFEGGGKPGKLITEEEIMFMTSQEFTVMKNEILEAIGGDTKRTVEAEPSKKNGAGKKKSGKSSSTGHGSASTEDSST